MGARHTHNIFITIGAIVLLQETHIWDESKIEIYWKMKYLVIGISTQSSGVKILYDNSYECLQSFKDNSGRLAIAVLKNDIEKLIEVNVYVPCDTNIGMDFMVSDYDKIFEILDKHQDAFLIMGGDMNVCMSEEEDSLNRNKSESEKRLTEYIRINNEKCEITDS